MAEYYRIKKETAVALADEARRLGNVEGELTTAQMKEIFESVNVEGDSSGTVDTTDILWHWWNGTININEIPFSVTYNLTNVKTSNYSQIAVLNEPYVVTLTPDNSEIDEITVLMSDTDITSDVYSDGVINIPNVTGDIVITAYSRNIIPDDYIKLEYVETTGTQYIDTGLIPSNHQMETVFEITTINNGTSNVYALFGTLAPQSFYYYMFALYNNVYYAGHNGARTIFGTQSLGKHTMVYNAIEDYGIILDGVEQVSGSPCVGTSNLYLFRRHEDSSMFVGRLYSMKITDKTTREIVRDFVPVLHISDNVVGLYDVTNGVFYTNAGSGTFLYEE